MTICGWSWLKMRNKVRANLGFPLRLGGFAGGLCPQRHRDAERRTRGLFLVMLIVAFCALTIFSQDATVPQQPVSDSPIDVSKYRLSKVYSNDFSKQQKIVFENDLLEKDAGGKLKRKAKPDPKVEWIVEGNGGVDVRDGKLRASPLRFDAKGEQIPSKDRSHLVIWNKNIFPADFLAEFDMSPNGSTNGLTIVFVCATSKDGGDIFDLSLPARQADYKTYHSGSIVNYSDSYWSRNTEVESVSNRLRKNPGFKLVAEGKSLTTGLTDVTHHVRILKFGGHIEIELGGKVIIRWDDKDKPLGAGRIGFRSMDGVYLITYDNFKVWKVLKK